MVSLIRLILNLLNKDKIVQVRRALPTKAMRAHLLGLTFGLLLVAINLSFNFQNPSVTTNAFILLWFALVTYFSGLLFFFSAALLLLLSFTALPPESFSNAFRMNGQWYFIGYLFGGAFAIFYNDLVFIFMNFIEKKRIKISFAYDPRKSVQIIKSPIASEETAFNSLDEKTKERKLYNYRVDPPPKYPYTIAIVANPKILKRGGDKARPFDYNLDPIIKDRDLFLRALDNALRSFELDEVLGFPEIWSRIRVMTIFDESLENANATEFGLIQEFQEDAYSSEDPEKTIGHNMLDPMKQMIANVQKMLDKAKNEHRSDTDLDMSDIDLVIGMSASETHDRATAHFADLIDTQATLDDPVNALPEVPEGQFLPFTCYADPLKRKKDYEDSGDLKPPVDENSSNYQIIYPEVDIHGTFRSIHEFWARWPGRAATNIYGARQKTYIHEFAHAMSSAYHGMIVDEYFDYFTLKDRPEGNPDEMFYINRIDRNRARIQSGEVIPVHKEFAEYNEIMYYSDLAHPSAEEAWTGYFPKRLREDIPCTMDRTFGFYRFDELLSIYIYERLLAKLLREEKPDWTSLDIVHTLEAVVEPEAFRVFLQSVESKLGREIHVTA